MTIEETILTALSAALDVPVYMEVPQSAPASYVLIEKTGGTMRDYIWRATFAVQSYADTLAEASELNDEVITAALAMPDSYDISKVELNSSYNFTDEAAHKRRYQSIFDIYY